MLIMEHVAYAVEILNCRAAIGSLLCSDEPALQGLCQCWSYACLLLNFIGKSAHLKQGVKAYIKTVNRLSVNRKTVNRRFNQIPEKVLKIF